MNILKKAALASSIFALVFGMGMIAPGLVGDNIANAGVGSGVGPGGGGGGGPGGGGQGGQGGGGGGAIGGDGSKGGRGF